MSITDVQSGYFNRGHVADTSKQFGCHRSCITCRSARISKTAWMDLYFDLYTQTHGEEFVNKPEVVLADAEARLKILKANRIRR